MRTIWWYCGVCVAVDFELNLCDVQPGVLGGAQEEFLYVGRLDNLGSCYTALEVCLPWCMLWAQFSATLRGGR